MAWIESHQELADHPKKDALADLLYGEGVDVDTADAATIGLLHRLWWWALSYAQDGDLSKYSESVVARGCRWHGDAHHFCASLKQAGFVDENGHIHDWKEYAGKLLERREKDAERKRIERKNGPSTDRRKKSRVRPKDVRRTSIRSAYVPTKPTNQPMCVSTPNGVATHIADDDLFAAFWQAYPRRIDKGRAQRAFTARLKAGESGEDMVTAARRYAAHHAQAGTDPQFIKHPATFIGPDMPFKEWVSGVPAGAAVPERKYRSGGLFAEGFSELEES